MMKKMGKKGFLGALATLPALAIIFVVTTIVFALGLVILANFQSNSTVATNSAANAAIGKGITAVSEIPNNWLLLFAIVVAAGMLITITVYALWKAGVGGFGGTGGRM